MDSKQMHVCRLCDKLLSSSSSLDRHMLTHSGERPFVCKRCHMTFTTNGNMHRHMRTHLHKDSLARQQQEQQMKTLVGTSGTSLSATSSTSPAASATTPASVATTNTLNQQLAQNSIAAAIDPNSMAAAAAAAVAMANGRRSFGHNRMDHNPIELPVAGSMNQQPHDSSVTALLNQQLVAAFKKQHQQQTSTSSNHNNRSSTSSSSSSSLATANTLHLDTTSSNNYSDQLFRGSLTGGAQELAHNISPTSAATLSAYNNSNQQQQLTQLSKMAAENPAISKFLTQQQGQLDSKAIMMGALQGDQLESVKAVMLAAAAAAAAAANQQQQQIHRQQPFATHRSPIMDGHHVKEESLKEEEHDLLDEHAEDRLEMESDFEPATTKYRLRGKRRKQVNPRCSTRPTHLSAASLNGDDSEDDGRRSSESLIGQFTDRTNNIISEALSSRLRHNQDDDDGTLSESSSIGARNLHQNLLLMASNGSRVISNIDDESTDADEDDENGTGDANNNSSHGLKEAPRASSASSTTIVKREDFNNNRGSSADVDDEENRSVDRLEAKVERGEHENEANRQDTKEDNVIENGSHHHHHQINPDEDEDELELDDLEDNEEMDEHGELENELDDEREFHSSSTRMNMSSMMTSEDESSSLGSDVNINMSDNNNSSQAPFANRVDGNDTDCSIQQQHHHHHNNDNSHHHPGTQAALSNSNNNADFSIINNHNQSLNPIKRQQNITLPNSLTSISGEVVEDISQSYVKTTNPNAARKGGKRNRHCYKCKLCTYSSVDRCTLVRHLRIHSGERPYICGICRYAFTTKANCERHVRKRHKKQYNSLGGSGGGGVKGSNGGGRSLIITDHSNHQTIPVKVNPVAAQTISQTLQRIQEKQQHHNNNNNNSIDDDLNNIERIPNNHHQTQHSHSNQQKRVESQLSINNNETTSLFEYKGKRKHRNDERLDEASAASVPYQRRRLMDKHVDYLGSTRLSSSRKNNPLINELPLSGPPNLFIPQPGSMANVPAPELSTTSELFTNLMAQLQQVTGGTHETSNINSNNGAVIGNLAQAASLHGSGAQFTSATFLANMLAAGKSLGVDVQQGLNSSQNLLSPKHLSQQIAQLRNLNSQTPFFIRRNPFDPFNPLNLAAQALDLSCKFQSSK